MPLVPDKPRGGARTDDRRVLNAIFYILHTVRLGAICLTAMARARRPQSI
ncbi:MAG: hypothetical protein EOR30_29850 [Mesorhizobium sp.]|nr:MAG: hypothetical protein EOR14_31695 [Mesorhizobium sp.]TGQ37844.1 hypothetical protein EN857_14210 [Mesorhizobium sp. M4B.F.Ca.ET.214.01.1.1]TGQ59611.1 hypothetical protein EN854_16940 [Mesorhizobium sp. M4B.F.Ca.ET.211.01.1.1]TGU34676.1 hypothetical protein EN793_16935 [Mesorhizobium sp. M4B.F.Ca.ET.150.01.1.1]RWI63193.1 MAG: hypothetical protein EOR17_29755 [Mesorhizobium sp.]